jgi:hypothetical protein
MSEPTTKIAISVPVSLRAKLEAAARRDFLKPSAWARQQLALALVRAAKADKQPAA